MIKQIIIAVCILLPFQMHGYRIQIQNTLDGALTVNITEGEVTSPHIVRPNQFFKYDTKGCYTIMLMVTAGRAVGQSAGIGSVFNKACRNYTGIARFTQEPSWNPITGKQILEPRIMELAEQ